MTTIERASVAAIVEAAYREGQCWLNGDPAQDQNWQWSDAKTDLDALLADKSLDADDGPNAGGQIPPASGGNLDRLVRSSESKGE